MPPPRNNDYNDLAALMQSVVTPLTTKLQAIDDKVNALSQDRVTRSDIEKLRSELVGSMVPRDAYEPRHLALVERQTTLEGSIREERKDRIDDLKAVRNDVEQDLQRVHERLESGKQQIEDRIKEQQDITLSDKDRLWIRWNQAIGFVAVAIALIELIMQHVKFN